MTRDSTTRFSDRVSNYVRWRPRYPEALFDAFVARSSLRAGDAVVDLGSGTGISTGPLLARDLEVYAVEPNREMRIAAEQEYGAHPRFHSTAAAAEETGLASESIDAAFAAQAFHWFDRERLGRELRRILRPGAFIGIAWNERLTDATPFLREYESLLHAWGTDYAAVDHTQISTHEVNDFLPRDFRTFTFANEQQFDYEGLEGRLLSSSYTPAAGDPRFEPMLSDLRSLFERHAEDGIVSFLYETKLYTGRFTA